MADANGRSDECVVRLTMEDISAHLRLLPDQKDVLYRRQANLGNRVLSLSVYVKKLLVITFSLNFR